MGGEVATALVELKPERIERFLPTLASRCYANLMVSQPIMDHGVTG
jgi:hypothetical protein